MPALSSCSSWSAPQGAGCRRASQADDEFTALTALADRPLRTPRRMTWRRSASGLIGAAVPALAELDHAGKEGSITGDSGLVARRAACRAQGAIPPARSARRRAFSTTSPMRGRSRCSRRCRTGPAQGLGRIDTTVSDRRQRRVGRLVATRRDAAASPVAGPMSAVDLRRALDGHGSIDAASALPACSAAGRDHPGARTMPIQARASSGVRACDHVARSPGPVRVPQEPALGRGHPDDRTAQG